MRKWAFAVGTLLAAVCFPHSAESTNAVSKPVGVIRITVAPSNQVLSALGVDPLDSRIARIFAGQLTEGISQTDSDNVLLWNNGLAVYDRYWKSGGVWRLEGEPAETTNILRPGIGH